MIRPRRRPDPRAALTRWVCIAMLVVCMAAMILSWTRLYQSTQWASPAQDTAPAGASMRLNSPPTPSRPPPLRAAAAADAGRPTHVEHVQNLSPQPLQPPVPPIPALAMPSPVAVGPVEDQQLPPLPLPPHTATVLVFTMDSLSHVEDAAAKGGPAGELAVRYRYARTRPASRVCVSERLTAFLTKFWLATCGV
jgi:hypothetical protein